MRRLWLAFVVVLGVEAAAGAAPLDPKQVPAPLAPWIPWVMRGHETETCPAVGGDDAEPLCRWSGRLNLVLDGKGGKFTQEWELLARASVPLPGDQQRWPLDVKVGGKSIAVVSDEEGGTPTIELPPGRHVVSGVFQWPSLPESLQVPSEMALLSL